MAFSLSPRFSLFSSRCLLAACAVGMVAFGCSSSGDGGGSDPGPAGTAPVPTTTPTTEPPKTENPPASCPRTAKAADRVRKVVVSHPFASAGVKGKAFEVLDLSEAGKLTRTNTTFEMRTAFSEIAFTPDGVVGIVAQDDGTLGVFTFDDAGKVKIVNPAFSGKFYASHVVVTKDGTRAFVLDAQTANNGGGVHEVAIGCDGSLSYTGLVVTGGKAHAMMLVPNDPDRAVLVAGKALDSPSGTYVHRLDVSGKTPQRKSSASAFPDEDAIASNVAVTPDGKYALVSDNGYFKGSRVVGVSLDGAAGTPPTPITTPNPAGVVWSPFGKIGLLMNSDGEDALRTIQYDPTKPQPFTIGAELTYVGGKTELPLIAHVVDRGKLRGHVLVAENVTIRQLTFAANDTITDFGPFSFGPGIPSIVGSLGVQP